MLNFIGIRTYILIKGSKRTGVGPALTETLATVGHLGDGLVRTSTLDTRVQNVVNSTAEPVSTLVTGRTSAVLDESGSRARRGEHCDS